MCLVCPGDVGRGDEDDGGSAVSRGRDKLVEGPILKDEADKEHEDPQRPEDGDRRYLAVLSVLYPQPSEQEHRKAIDGPEGEDASDRVFARKLPGMTDWVAEDLAWRRRNVSTRRGRRGCETGEGAKRNIPAMTSGPWKFSSGWR